MNNKCPICSSKNKSIISLLSNNMKVMGSSFPESTSNIVNCDQCGSVYIDTIAQQSHFNQYYNSGYSKTISYYEAFGKEVTNEYFNNIYEYIKQYISKKSHILDMGAGRGEFSKYLQEKEYTNVLAMEPSKTNYEHIKNIGIECVNEDSFSNNENLKNKFDLVILSHTLEHILDFKLAMDNVKSLLSKNGIVYIEVPDSEKYIDVDFPPYFFFTYEHIIHFTQKTFKNLANSYGYELLESNSYLKGSCYYVSNCILKNSDVFLDIKYTDETIKAVENYIEYSKTKLKPVVEKFEESQEPLILWGIGASTAQLLNETFDNCEINALVDNNPSRQGLTYKIGNELYTIQAPNQVSKESATIVVLPVMYKKEIIKQIRMLGYKNKITSLI